MYFNTIKSTIPLSVDGIRRGCLYCCDCQAGVLKTEPGAPRGLLFQPTHFPSDMLTSILPAFYIDSAKPTLRPSWEVILTAAKFLARKRRYRPHSVFFRYAYYSSETRCGLYSWLFASVTSGDVESAVGDGDGSGYLPTLVSQ